MNCGKCGDKPTTVGEVLDCKTCRDDGTANEIPKDMARDAPLVDAVVRKGGLGNRFSLPVEPAKPAPREAPRPKKPTR